MRYFENSDPKNDSFGALSRRVSYFKYERGVDSMCKIVQDYAKKYAKDYGDEREIRGKIETVTNMLADSIPLDKALKYAKLDKDTYKKYSQDQ